MRHNLHVRGPAFCLRPVTTEDAAFIVALRTDERRNSFIHHTSPLLEVQQRWLEEYFAREGDYYFVVETLTGELQGVIGIYDCNEREAEWGRWILRKGSLAALESAMLIHELGFASLGLEEVYCRTAAANKSVLSIHDSMNVPRVALHEGLFNLPQGTCDAVEHRLTRADWAKLKDAWYSKAQRLAEKIGQTPR